MYYLSVWTRSTRRWAISAGIATLVVASWSPQRAHADWTDHTALGLELGLGSIITIYSPEARDSGSVFLAGVRGSYDLAPDISVALLLHNWSLPGANHATMPGLGLRYEPFQSSVGRAFIDAAAGPTWTDERLTFGYDVGGGFEVAFPMVPGLGIGPAFHYGQAINPAVNSNLDGRAWSLGLSVSVRLGEWSKARAAEKAKAPNSGKPVKPFTFNLQDSDHDGVSDESDQCPDVPAGKHPDVFRAGCPENDEDGDGIPDTDDVCPATPAGDQPDRARPGCPFVDSDGDGIPDMDDHCPDKAGPKTGDQATNGCPPVRKAEVKGAPEAQPEAPPTDYKPVSKRRLSGPRQSTPQP